MVARDLALAAYEEQPIHLLHLSARESVDELRRAQAAGVRGDRRGDAAPPGADRRGGALARREPEDEPAAAVGRRPRRAGRRRCATARSRRSPPTTRRTPPTRRTCRSRRRRSASPASRRRSPSLYTHLVGPGLLPLATLLERMSAGPARAYGLDRRGSSRARRRTSSCSTRRRPGASARTASARARRTRGCSARRSTEGRADRRRRADRVRHERAGRSANDRLSRTRGRHGLPRPAVGARRLRLRRGGVHDRDDRLPGARHRPELRGADRLLHGADGRQLRRRRRALASPAPSRAAVRDARGARAPSGRTGCTSRGVVALAGVDTRSLVLHLRERGAMRRRRSRATHAVDEVLAEVRAQPSMEGAALVGRRLAARAVPFATRRSVRVAVVDYGAKRSILRRLAQAGAAVTVYPHDVDADTLAAYDGVLLSNGPGDPEPLVEEIAHRRRTARARAGARHLPRPPAARARDRARDLQASVRPPRREPSGARRDAAACSSRARTTASRSPRAAPRP